MAKIPDKPQTDLEQYLNRIATGEGEYPAEPHTNVEQYLDYIIENGIGGGGEAKVVDELPAEGETGYIYLVLKESTKEGDIYDEWIWALQQDGETYGWEHLGATNEVSIKLYDTEGDNTDGAMTQKAATAMKGKAKVLTTADYNYPTNNPTGVALWLLEPGVYEVGGDFLVRDTSTSTISNPGSSGRGAIAIVGGARTDGGVNTKPIVSFAPNGANAYYAIVNKDTGVKSSRGRLLLSSDVKNVLISTSATDPLSANQGRILNEKIGDLTALDTTAQTDLVSAINELAGKGAITELTTADYDYPTGDPYAVAAWQLPDGIYRVSSGTVVYQGTQGFRISDYATFCKASGGGFVTYIMQDANGAPRYSQVNANGSNTGTNNVSLAIRAINNLTSTDANNALSAYQGRVLKDLIDSIAIRGAGAPTTSTVGEVGQLYEDGTNGALYQLKSIDITTTPNTYNWEEVGGGPTVVQTTGTSRTDVMSQNAVTSMFFADPIFQTMIQIGSGARVPLSSQYSLALGANADAAGNHPYSVALGAYSIVSSRGEVAIGLRSTSTDGYNNSAYRLLTGLYDPQSAHDAANKEYVDNLAVTYAALNGTAAPTTATAGTYVGQLYLDTTNDKMYYLASIDDTADPVEYNWSGIGGGPNVVQTTGTSTTDVMSQNAVTSMVYADPSSKRRIVIPNGTASVGTDGEILIGSGQASTVGMGTSVGTNVKNFATGGTTLGYNTQTGASAPYSVALGAGATATREEVNVGTGIQSWGYNGTRYRLIGGVHDGVDDHDAVTVGQLNTAIAGVSGAAEINSTDWSNLWQ